MTHNPGKTSPQSHSVHEVRGGVMLPAETLFYSLLTFFLFFFLSQTENVTWEIQLK